MSDRQSINAGRLDRLCRSLITHHSSLITSANNDALQSIQGVVLMQKPTLVRNSYRVRLAVVVPATPWCGASDAFIDHAVDNNQIILGAHEFIRARQGKFIVCEREPFTGRIIGRAHGSIANDGASQLSGLRVWHCGQIGGGFVVGRYQDSARLRRLSHLYPAAA